MAAKQGKKVLGKAKKLLQPAVHPNWVDLTIPAGCAQPAPPLGPQLTTYSINVQNFCREFNEKTKLVKPGVPIPTLIKVRPDRSLDIQTRHPPVSFLLKQAAGIKKGAMQPPKETAGIISLKHVYEIAKLKHADPNPSLYPLEEMVRRVIGIAHRMGIKVCRTISEDEIREFQARRRVELEQQARALQEARQAKLQRTTTTAA